MARSRNIKPSFFKNEDLSEISYAGRLLFIGLWTIADKRGVFEYRPKRIKAEIFPYDSYSVEEVIRDIADLEKYNFLELFTHENKQYAHIKTFSVHQNPHYRENELKCPIPSEKQTFSQGNKSKDEDHREKALDNSSTYQEESQGFLSKDAHPSTVYKERGIRNKESCIKNNDDVGIIDEITNYYMKNIRNEYKTPGRENLIKTQKRTKTPFQDLFQYVKNYHKWVIDNDKVGFAKNMRNFFGKEKVYEDFLNKPDEKKMTNAELIRRGEMTPEDEEIQRRMEESFKRENQN